MRLLLALLPAVVVHAGLWAQDNDDDKKQLAVPGRNPLVYCQKPDDYILAIDHVDLKPNPPEAGKNLTVTALGTLSQPVQKGAKVKLSVKYGLIKIINQEIDLCDQAKNADLKCPLQKGDVTIEKIVALPKHIPPGKYAVQADAYTKNEEEITCMEGSITFGKGGGGGGDDDDDKDGSADLK